MSKPNILSGTAALLAAGALTVATAGMAGASTEIAPAGDDVTATGNTLTINDPSTGDILRCNNVSGDGTIPDGSDNPESSTGGIDVDINNVDLGTCNLNGTTIQNTTIGSGWQLNASGDNYDSSTDEGSEGALLIPDDGAVLEADDCVVTVEKSTIGPLDYDNGDSAVTANDEGTINYTSNGEGSFCPDATDNGEAELSGTLTFKTDPDGDDVKVTD